MKKSLIPSLTLLSVLAFFQAEAQPFATQNLGLPLANSTHTVWGDYDNDGDLDLLYSGYQSGTGTSLTYLYKNNNGNMVNSGVTLKGIATGVPNVLDFGDVNNDGWLDILVCGNNKAGLYLNNQTGGFSEYASSLDAYTDVYGGFYDLNGDGWVDILLGAYVWINNGAMSFTRKSSGLPYYQFNNLDVGDYDLDGFKDVALIGNGTLEIYKNDGTGSFSAIGAGLTGYTQYHLGSGMYVLPNVIWADFDQDGDPDLLVNGYVPSIDFAGGAIYENKGFGTFELVSQGFATVLGKYGIVDYNFDGFLDLIISGYQTSLKTDITQLWINEGSFLFNYSGISLTTTTNPGLSVTDYQQDRDPDILMTGNSASRLFRNDNTNKNTPPAYPSTFKIKEVGNQTHFYWDTGSDNETQSAALTYNLRIGTVANPSSVRPSDANPGSGFLRTVKPGNAGTFTEVYVSGLAAGETYTTSVQTVDNNYLASEWYPDYVFTLPPASPELTGITGLSNSGFTVNWKASYGAKRYDVYISADENFTSYLPGFGPAMTSDTWQVVSGVEKYTTYYVKVVPVNDGGEGSAAATKVFVTDGLVASYDFSGDARDAGPFRKDLTNHGAVLVADRFGNPNSAYYFNSSKTTYLAADASELPTAERTISMWVKSEDVPGYSFLMTYGGNTPTGSNFQFAWYPGEPGRWDMKESFNYWLTSQAKESVNKKWIHLVGMTGPNGTKIYVNGKQVASNNTFFKNTFTAGTLLFIGASGNTYGTAWEGNGFVGAIDEVKIYNRELTDNEVLYLAIKDDYNPTPVISGLTVYGATGSTFTASWNQPGDISNYNYQIASDAAFTQLVPGYESVLTTANSVKLVGLSPNTTYFFRVRTVGYEQTGPFEYSDPITTTTGLIAEYTFDGHLSGGGQFGKALDNHGTVFTTDRFGNQGFAVHFDGSTYLMGDASDLPTRERSISLWVKLQKTDGYNFMMSYGGSDGNTSYNLSQHGSQFIIDNYWNSILGGTFSDSPLDNWAHLVTTTGTNGTRIYLNGVMIGNNAAFTTSTVTFGKKIAFGGRLKPDGLSFEGSNMVGDMDDIRIYDRELSVTEITGLYHEGDYNPQPGKISNLASSGVTGTGFLVTWNPAVNAVRYRVELSEKDDFTTLISSQDITVTGFSFSGLSPLNTYYVRVTPYNNYGFAPSDQISVTTTSGLVSQYDFSGNTQDSGPAANNLGNAGAELTADRFGNANSAYLFDGTDYLVGFASPLPKGERTISLWVKPSDLSNRPHFLSYGGGSCGTSFFMAYDYKTANQGWSLSGHCDANTMTWLPPNSPAGNWTHFVIRAGQSGKDMFINGVLVAHSNSEITETNTTGKELYIGALVNTSGTGVLGFYTKGVIDDIRIYDAALPDEQVLSLYYEGGWQGVPPIPAVQQASSVSDLSFVASWKPADRATGYYLDVSKDPGFSSFISGYDGYSTPSTDVAVSGLSELTTYYYRVRAFNLAGASDYSQTISVTTSQSPLTSPVALDAGSVQDNGFLAKWEPQTAPGQYQVEVATDITFANLIPGYNPRTVENINSVSSVVVAGLQPVTTYFYRLRGVRGTEVSDYSNSVEVTTKAKPVVPDRPVVLDATAIDLHQFTANWTESSGAIFYNVYVATDSLFTSQLTTWDPKNVTETSVIVNSLNAGRRYWYRVKAGNLVGLSAYSDSVKVETLFSAPVSQPPTLPTNGGFTANWLQVTNAAYYLLDVSDNADFTDFVPGYMGLRVNSTSTAVTGLTTSADYFYRVRAVSAFGVVSPNSNAVTVSVTYNEIIAPVATEATNVNATSFVANWESVPGAGQYEIQVSTDGFTSWTTKTSVANFVLVSGLNAFTDYEYKVRAKIAGVWSDWSNIIPVTTSGALGSPSLTASNYKTTSFDLTWTEVALATGYTIVVAENAEFTVLFDSLYTTSTTLTVTGLTENKTYYVRGYSVRGKFSSLPSSVQTVKTLSGLPDAPVATDATNITDISYQANWNPVANAQSYEVQQSTNGFVSWVKQNVTVNKATFSSLNPATTYKYRVNVTDINGKISGYSNEITVTTKSGILAAPVLNNPTLIAQTGFTLSWSTVPGAVEYYVDVATQEDFAVASILPDYKNKKVSSTGLLVSGLNPGVTYWARVRGYDSKAYGEYSNTVSAKTLSQSLATPVLNVPSAITPTSFTLSWTDVTGETGYQVNVSLNSSFSPNLSGYDKKDVATNSITVTGLTPGTLYYVQVRAVNTTTVMFGSYSSTGQVTTTVAVPDLLDPDQIQTTSFRAKWNSVIGVGSYRLDVSEDIGFTKLLSGYNDKVIPSTSTTQVVSGLTKKTTYYFRMRSVKGSFTSDHSAIKTVTTEDEAAYQILTSADPIGGGTAGGGGNYSPDTSITLTAVRNSGYNFVNWKEGQTVVSDNPSYTFQVNSNRNLVANFTTTGTVENEISLTSENWEGNSWWKNQNKGSWFPNSMNNVSRFGIDNVSVGALRTLSQYSENTVIRADFTTYLTTGGTNQDQMYIGFTNQWIVYNDQFSGYNDVFIGLVFEGGQIKLKEIREDVVEQDRIIGTYQSGYSFGLSFSYDPSGKFKVSGEGLDSVIHGKMVNSMLAFRFGVVTSNSDYNHGFDILNFMKIVQYNITTISSPTNGGTTSGGGYYYAGAPVNVVAVPGKDYNFVKWTEGGTQVSANASYTFSAGANRTLVANFSPKATLATPVLNAPSNKTQTGFTISWNAVSGATGYRYDLALDNTFSQTVTGYVNELTASTNVSVTGRSPNTTYYFRVKAVNETNESEYSDPSGIKTLPSLPVAPTVSAPTGVLPTSFTANWQSVSGADSYLLDVSTDQNFVSGVWILQNESVSATQKLVSGLTPSTDYYYRVRAKNEGGESGNSGVQKATTPSGKPDQPVLSASTSIGSTGFTINWTSVAGAESYKLDVGTNNPITVFIDGYNNKTVTGLSETLTGLTPGLTFYYQLRAVNSYGASLSSSVGTTLLIPAAPTANLPTNETSTSFTANWQAATGASGYSLDVSESNLFTDYVPGYENKSVAGTSSSVVGLTANRTYFYRVRATNSSGLSGYSNVVSITLLPLAPAFSGLTVNPATAVLGSSDVEIKITIANAPTGVFLYYGGPTASALTQVVMTPSGGQYAATISKGSYTKEGLIFRISAENERGKSWYPAENQVTSIPVSIPAQNIITEVLPTSSFPAGVEKQTWNTLSLPFTGSVNLATILGTQELSNGEPVNWAAYTFNGDFVSTTTLTGGQAVFLYHKAGDGANLIKNTVTGAGTLITYDQNAFGNTLLANGWNLIAWPYLYGAQITVKDGTKVSSVWQQHGGSWEKNANVKPFGGYAIYNKTGSGGLKVSDVLSWTTQNLSKITESDLKQYDAEWLIKLGVSTDKLTDSYNYIGVSYQASAGVDLLDERNPVSPGSGLDLFVSEENGSRPVSLAASIKNAGKGLKVWSLTVTNSTRESQVKLNWEHLNVPDDITLVLVDLTSKRTVDLQKSKTGVITLSGADESKLQILAGTPDEIESAIDNLKSDLTISFMLFPNYPNPFNPTTLISFEMGREDVVDLAIFNSIGQRIKTVYSGVALAGKHQIEWNGKDDSGNPVSSGVYFCTMKAATFTKTNKMILTR